MNQLKKYYLFSPEVKAAIDKNLPVLALESTIIAHGMPYPQNIEFARQAEKLARNHGATPATIAIINGTVHLGVNDKQLKILTSSNDVHKIAVRDIAWAISNKLTGATTVSATMRLAHLAGIKAFATGGIGGVHRNAETTFDVSQDLTELAQTPMVVISAGCKAILDIPKTLECLETATVPVVGYQTDEFPAFYSRSSGCKVTASANSPKNIAQLFNTHSDLGLSSAILIANPVPAANEIAKNIIQKYIDAAQKECEQQGITGKGVTPFLLKKIVTLSNGKSLNTNIALALNNVNLGAQIAKEISKSIC